MFTRKKEPVAEKGAAATTATTATAAYFTTRITPASGAATPEMRVKRHENGEISCRPVYTETPAIAKERELLVGAAVNYDHNSDVPAGRVVHAEFDTADGKLVLIVRLD